MREFMMRGSHTETEWMFQIERQSGLCFYCFISLRDDQGRWRGTRDHLTPIAKGGTDNIDNIVAACWPCNKRKGNRTLGEYRTFLNQQENAISEASTIPASKNLVISNDQWPRVHVLNQQLQKPFLRLLAIHDAAALVFRGISFPDQRKKMQAQVIEVNQRRA